MTTTPKRTHAVRDREEKALKAELAQERRLLGKSEKGRAAAEKAERAALDGLAVAKEQCEELRAKLHTNQIVNKSLREQTSKAKADREEAWVERKAAVTRADQADGQAEILKQQAATREQLVIDLEHDVQRLNAVATMANQRARRLKKRGWWKRLTNQDPIGAGTIPD